MAIGSGLARAALIGVAVLLSASCARLGALTAQPPSSPGVPALTSPSPSYSPPSPSASGPGTTSSPESASSPETSSPETPSGPGTVPTGYREYANPRFGFTTFWPSSFRTQPPPEDGDGLGWASPDGLAELSAYGSNNVMNWSPRQDESADSQGVSVSYSDITGNIVTVSGYKDHGRIIVYQRDVVGSGSIDTLYWRYPTSQKAQWNAAVTLTAHTFQPGDVATGH